jgi:hypothetical protein
MSSRRSPHTSPRRKPARDIAITVNRSRAVRQAANSAVDRHSG